MKFWQRCWIFSGQILKGFAKISKWVCIYNFSEEKFLSKSSTRHLESSSDNPVELPFHNNKRFSFKLSKEKEQIRFSSKNFSSDLKRLIRTRKKAILTNVSACFQKIVRKFFCSKSDDYSKKYFWRIDFFFRALVETHTWIGVFTNRPRKKMLKVQEFPFVVRNSKEVAYSEKRTFSHKIVPETNNLNTTIGDRVFCQMSGFFM